MLLDVSVWGSSPAPWWDQRLRVIAAEPVSHEPAPEGLPGLLMLSIPTCCWEHPSYTGAVSRNAGRVHREGLHSGMGSRRRTHSTFLRETFWLGRVAETVM